MMSVTLADILPLLQGVKQTGSGFTARCPAHDDKTASLSVKEGDGGRILFHCHAGCPADSVAAAIGLKLADLMGEDKRPQATAQEVARYRYGRFEKVRKSDKSFYWSPKLDGAEPGLYSADVLNTSDFVFVVEGEKDVETMKRCGLPAVCTAFGAGGGNKWRPGYNALFTGKRVYILPDNDEVGYAFAWLEHDQIATTAKSVQVLDLLAVYPQLKKGGDISDIHVAVGKVDTIALLKRAMKMPPPRKRKAAATAIAWTFITAMIPQKRRKVKGILRN